MRIDTKTGIVIVAPRAALPDIVCKFERKTAKRRLPWNIIRINAQVGESLDLLMPLCSGPSRYGNFLIVIPNGEEVPANRWPDLIMRIRRMRHYGLACAFGFRSQKSVPEKVASLARVNLFNH